MLRNNQQLIQLVVVALFVLGPVLGSVWKALMKQAEKRKAELDRQRREHELLRTGRTTDEPGLAPEERRLRQEIAARRETELAELRQRMARAREDGGADVGGILVQIPGTSGPIVIRRVPRSAPAPGRTLPAGAAPTAPPFPDRASPPTGRTGRSRRSKRGRPAPSPTAPPAGVSAPPAAPFEMEETTRRLTVDEPPAPASVTGLPTPMIDAKALTPNDWRRALVMREILGPPLANRGPSEPGRY